MKVWELEEGKEYVDKIFNRRYSIMNSELKYLDKNGITWSKSDKGFKELMELDLEPYTQPTDWSKVKVDTKILVKDSTNETWCRRHFAKFENGKIYAWTDGYTSWTSDYEEVIAWKYAKLAEESEE